jgi:hypothetical protein
LGKLAKTSNPHAALEWFDRGVRTYEAVLKEHPGHTEAAGCLVHVLAGRAGVLAELDRHSDALENYDRGWDWTMADTVICCG